MRNTLLAIVVLASLLLTLGSAGCKSSSSDNNDQLNLIIALLFLQQNQGSLPEGSAPPAQTGQTDSFAAGDDGDLQMGVVLPEPRFADNGDGTVTDLATGLVWIRDPSIFGQREWRDALSDCANLADGTVGLNDGSSPGDWRLPNINELNSLIDYGENDPALPDGHPFAGLANDIYWTSTHRGALQVAPGGEFIYVLDLGLGQRQPGLVVTGSTERLRFWPVRGPILEDPPLLVPVTGRITSAEAGDDGDLQVGSPWPPLRFFNLGNGTVYDALTGLTWLRNAQSTHRLSWLDAVNYCNDLSAGGLNDWRLPNVREISSLADMEEGAPALPSGHPFLNVNTEVGFWTSTSTTDSGTGIPRALTFRVSTGGVAPDEKLSELHVWAVRGGPPAADL